MSKESTGPHTINTIHTNHHTSRRLKCIASLYLSRASLWRTERHQGLRQRPFRALRRFMSCIPPLANSLHTTLKWSTPSNLVQDHLARHLNSWVQAGTKASPHKNNTRFTPSTRTTARGHAGGNIPAWQFSFISTAETRQGANLPGMQAHRTTIVHSRRFPQRPLASTSQHPLERATYSTAPIFPQYWGYPKLCSSKKQQIIQAGTVSSHLETCGNSLNKSDQTPHAFAPIDSFTISSPTHMNCSIGTRAMTRR